MLLVPRLDEAEFNIPTTLHTLDLADSATVSITAKVSVCVLLETALRLDVRFSEH